MLSFEQYIGQLGWPNFVKSIAVLVICIALLVSIWRSWDKRPGAYDWSLPAGYWLSALYLTGCVLLAESLPEDVLDQCAACSRLVEVAVKYRPPLEEFIRQSKFPQVAGLLLAVQWASIPVVVLTVGWLHWRTLDLGDGVPKKMMLHEMLLLTVMGWGTAGVWYFLEDLLFESVNLHWLAFSINRTRMALALYAGSNVLAWSLLFGVTIVILLRWRFIQHIHTEAEHGE